MSMANVALNGLVDRVRPLRVAVSNGAGRAQLAVLKGRMGASWIAVDRDKIRKAQAARAEPAEIGVVDVETVTLDGLTDAGLIDRERLGMVWIDVEGHEGHVLEGAGTLAERESRSSLSSIHAAWPSAATPPGCTRWPSSAIRTSSIYAARDPASSASS
jgi:FkbM family methyltransferase